MRLSRAMTRAEIVALERRYVWPPYTSSERHEGRDPLVVVSAEGAWLEDADGRRVLDANGSWWSCTLGHRHPRLMAALRAQAEVLPHVAAGGITHAPVARLAEALVTAAPEGLSRVHFSDDGSTAVEAAVKMAFQYWQQNGRPERRRFLALAGAYHGDTLGAASLASVEEFSHVFAPLLFEVLRPPSEGDAGSWEAVFSHAVELVRSRGDELAGVVVEPVIQGAAGMRMHPPELLRALRAACDEVDTFLIADEVFTGYGRTGAMWGCELAGVRPDLLCVAKGFTAGVLPMAATLASDRVYEGFRGGASRALLHGHTFCGNPLGAAVALEVLAVYRDEDILGGVRERAATIAHRFESFGEIAGVRRTRSRGAVGAVDLGEGGYLGAHGWAVFEAALARGVFLRPLGDTVYIAPPLNIPLTDLELLLDAVEESLREVGGK